MLLIIVMQVQS